MPSQMIKARKVTLEFADDVVFTDQGASWDGGSLSYEQTSGKFTVTEGDYTKTFVRGVIHTPKMVKVKIQ